MQTKVRYLEWIRYFLMREYVGTTNADRWPGNNEFRQGLLKIVNHFLPTEEEKHVAWPGQLSEALKTYTRCSNTLRVAHQYAKCLQNLAHDFGLRPGQPLIDWWGYEWLHHLASNDMKFIKTNGISYLEKGVWLGRFVSEPAYEKSFVLLLTLPDTLNTKEREHHVIKKFREWHKQTTEELNKKGFSTPADRELLRHIHWLYLRICPQPDLGRPWGFERIAQGEHTVRQPVGRVVKSLIDILDLSLPTIPSGRPRQK